MTLRTLSHTSPMARPSAQAALAALPAGVCPGASVPFGGVPGMPGGKIGGGRGGSDAARLTGRGGSGRWMDRVECRRGSAVGA